jgi:hypothetical protein
MEKKEVQMWEHMPFRRHDQDVCMLGARREFLARVCHFMD